MPNVDVDNRGRVVQIAPNRIGIVDTGHSSGYQQLVIFDYDSNTKSFNIVGTLNYEEYFTHPEKYGIPVRKNDANKKEIVSNR